MENSNSYFKPNDEYITFGTIPMLSVDTVNIDHIQQSKFNVEVSASLKITDQMRNQYVPDFKDSINVKLNNVFIIKNIDNTTSYLKFGMNLSDCLLLYAHYTNGNFKSGLKVIENNDYYDFPSLELGSCSMFARLVKKRSNNNQTVLFMYLRLIDKYNNLNVQTFVLEIKTFDHYLALVNHFIQNYFDISNNYINKYYQQASALQLNKIVDNNMYITGNMIDMVNGFNESILTMKNNINELNKTILGLKETLTNNVSVNNTNNVSTLNENYDNNYSPIGYTFNDNINNNDNIFNFNDIINNDQQNEDISYSDGYEECNYSVINNDNTIDNNDNIIEENSEIFYTEDIFEDDNSQQFESEFNQFIVSNDSLIQINALNDMNPLLDEINMSNKLDYKYKQDNLKYIYNIVNLINTDVNSYEKLIDIIFSDMNVFSMNAKYALNNYIDKLDMDNYNKTKLLIYFICKAYIKSGALNGYNVIKNHSFTFKLKDDMVLNKQNYKVISFLYFTMFCIRQLRDNPTIINIDDTIKNLNKMSTIYDLIVCPFIMSFITHPSFDKVEFMDNILWHYKNINDNHKSFYSLYIDKGLSVPVIDKELFNILLDNIKQYHQNIGYSNEVVYDNLKDTYYVYHIAYQQLETFMNKNNEDEGYKIIHEYLEKYFKFINIQAYVEILEKIKEDPNNIKLISILLNYDKKEWPDVFNRFNIDIDQFKHPFTLYLLKEIDIKIFDHSIGNTKALIDNFNSKLKNIPSDKIIETLKNEFKEYSLNYEQINNKYYGSIKDI